MSWVTVKAINAGKWRLRVGNYNIPLNWTIIIVNGRPLTVLDRYFEKRWKRSNCLVINVNGHYFDRSGVVEKHKSTLNQ